LKVLEEGGKMGLKYYLRGLGVGIAVTALIMGIAASVDSGKNLSDDEIRERAKALGMVEESSVLADTFAQGNADPPTGEAAIGESPEGEEEPEPVVSPSPDKAADKTSGSEEGKETAGPSGTPKATEAKTSEPAASPRATVKDAKPSETPAAVSTPTPVPTATPTPEPVSTQAPEPEPAETPTPKPATEAQQGESVTIRIASGDSSFTVCKKLAEAGLVESAADYDTYLCRNGYDKHIRAGSFEIPAGADEEEIAGIILKLN